MRRDQRHEERPPTFSGMHLPSIRAILLFFGLAACYSGNSQNISSEKTGKTYALVIGIANYENRNIPNLNFSNRDAQVFAEYLQSPAGGLIPSSQIRLLIDTNATTAAIYNALNWLRDKCSEDREEDSTAVNTIFFYYSGHGDLESETMHELGFLLAYNTPANNYINNAVRLEDLNYYANTLSIRFRAKVILITDACHSGKLAGSDYRGSFLVGKNLSTAKANEIRIAACAPEELSNENQAWGGGRGVFSYYLINGLKGLADRNSDSVVTLNEIKFFLDSSIANDAVLKENRLKQTPVLCCNQAFPIARVNREEMIQLTNQMIQPVTLPESGKDYFLRLLKKRELLESLDFTALNKLSSGEIPAALTEMVIKSGNDSLQREKLMQYKAVMAASKEEEKSFIEYLVESLHNAGQNIINLYLQGDAAELERRRYYNKGRYDIYPDLCAVALKLVPPDLPLARILKVNQYYFSGLALRLKIPATEPAQQKKLIESALGFQQKALALEEGAPFLQNEIGILMQGKGEWEKAGNYFQKATELSPSWALPWANLCGLYALTQKTEMAIHAGHVADSLQGGLHTTATNMGLAYEKTGNELFAEEYYRQAIDFNSRHFFPFERLGYVYMNTTQYAQADSFFHEADIRKKGYHFEGSAYDLIAVLAVSPASFNRPCAYDTSVISKDDVFAFFNWGMDEYEQKHYAAADRIFRRVIALDYSNPLVFHYLGKVYYDQQKWEPASLMFRFAMQNHLDDSSFNLYCDSMIARAKLAAYPYDHKCFEEYFRRSYYTENEDHYFIASVFEHWSHFAEAEEAYREIIGSYDYSTGAYVKLWRLLEDQRRYTEAEKVIREYEVTNEDGGAIELNAFYQRMMERYPDEGHWPHQLGLLFYNRAFEMNDEYLDTIIYFPLLNREVFMDLNEYNSLAKDPQKALDINGDRRLMEPPRLSKKSYRSQTITLPGTNEMLQLAQAPLYTPRKDGIHYFLLADSLLKETETLADINFKIGNLYRRAGSVKQAYPYFARSVALVPENANVRMNLADAAASLYKNRAALEQLNYLYDSNRIDFAHRMALAGMLVHKGEYEKAKNILEAAQTIYPYPLPEINDLLGRTSMLSGKTKEAIAYYQSFLKLNPGDSNVFYTLAKLYRRSGNNTEAWKWLSGAISRGFHYGFVLNNDDTWAQFRSTKKWKDLLKGVTMRTYYTPPLR